MVVWLIGLAGAGKTTLAKALFGLMKPANPATVLIDGDRVREIMGGEVGHTLEARRNNGWRMCRLCKYLDEQEIDVVCATLSQFHDQQDWNRQNFSRYFEIFLDVPMEVLIKRDQKGLYSGALAGKIKDVVGLDMPFPPPRAPDLVIENSAPIEDFTPLALRALAGIRARHSDWGKP